MSAPAREPRLHLRGGFTLLEMMVVLLVLMIAASLAMPMIGQSDGAKLRSAAHLLAADLDFARIGSITHSHAPRLAVFDTAYDRYHIAPAATPDIPLTNPVTRRDYITRFGFGRARQLAGVELTDHDLAGDDRLAFGIYGQLDQDTPATITLAAGDQRITVIVDPVSGETNLGALAPR